MKKILDLHIHSRFSRACSRDLTLENLDKTCRVKGVDIIATGDFTHPTWFMEIKEQLEEVSVTSNRQVGSDKNQPYPLPHRRTSIPLLSCMPLRDRLQERGLFSLKTAQDDRVRFILSTELALIYKQSERTRRIHIVIHAPNIEAAQEFNNHLEKSGYNIKSDGRPILGMTSPDLVKLCLAIHPKFLVYPAHIWTPWFSVFGSKSGFDTMEECFREQTEHIYAIETGLSSDPEMNWRLSALDGLTVISNSDAHSPINIAREANIMDLEDCTYDEIYEAIKNKDLNKLKGTIEFYPEEGMYHYDGHRSCGVRFEPEETRKHQGICPVCKKPLVIGVLYRVEELADRPEGYVPEKAAPFRKLVELDKIIAEAMGVKSRIAKQVRKEYDSLIKAGGDEMNILLDLSIDELKDMTLPAVAEGIRRVRAGELTLDPGFDGQYGTVKIFNDEEKKENKQGRLF